MSFSVSYNFSIKPDVAETQLNIRNVETQLSMLKTTGTKAELTERLEVIHHIQKKLNTHLAQLEMQRSQQTLKLEQYHGQYQIRKQNTDSDIRNVYVLNARFNKKISEIKENILSFGEGDNSGVTSYKLTPGLYKNMGLIGIDNIAIPWQSGPVLPREGFNFETGY